MRWNFSNTTRVALALGFASLTSIALFVIGAVTNHSSEFRYLVWNLFLAWIPLLLSIWLLKILHHNLWSSWLAIIVTLLWVGFLPNSFYMISDFIHVQDIPRVDLLYDVVMFCSFIFNGVMLGFFSLYGVHRALAERVNYRSAHITIAGVLALCSFAIYIGRELRWNTWDILVNPGGLLVDISSRMLNPASYPDALATTLTFFALLGSVYVVVWQAARMLRYQR